MRRIVVAIAAAALMWAQAPDPAKPDLYKKVEFEVASIRPAIDDHAHDTDTDRGFFHTHNLTLKRLISDAYRVDMRQIFGGPAWVDSDSYDINAKIPAEFAESRTRDTIPEMLQSLLADRFHLVIHREPRQASGYLLVVTKKGPKMQPTAPDAQGSNSHTKKTHLTAENVSMAGLARYLSRNNDIGAMVIDKTGLTGGFNFELDWAPERVAAASDDRVSIFTAIVEQLGLKLESAKVPIEAIVIDRAEKPEGN